MSAPSKLVGWRYLTCLACAAVALISTAVASGAPARGASHTPKCRASNTEVWLGDGMGGGVLGGVFYPLEFSNVGRRACSLSGYPRVSAIRGSARVGPVASRITGAHTTLTLAPGATAHAILKISDWGALCSKEIAADGLKVVAPGQTTAEAIDFPFGACAHRGVLSVGPLRAGVGIPGYTTS